MGGGTYGGEGRRIQGFDEETWPSRRGEDNIKMNLQEVGWEGVDRLIWVRITDKLRAAVNTVMNLLFSWNTANIWRSLVTVRCDTSTATRHRSVRCRCEVTDSSRDVRMTTRFCDTGRKRQALFCGPELSLSVPLRSTLHPQNYVSKWSKVQWRSKHN